MVESLILMYGQGLFCIKDTNSVGMGCLYHYGFLKNEVLIQENHKKGKDDLFKNNRNRKYQTQN